MKWLPTALALALALAPITAPASTKAPASPQAIATQQILAIVKATPQLKIDRSIPPSSAFDPKTHPYINIQGAPEGQAVGGYLMAEDAHRGTLKAGGYDVLAVPLYSGGSGGVFTQIVFARRSNAPLSYVGYISSAGHLRVEITKGALVATLPYYGAKDANCCPSKLIVQTYTIRGAKLHQVAEKTVPTPKPSP